MESRTRWLVVTVGCALLAAGLASEEMSMLHDLADPPPPELPVYDPRADSLQNPHANATKGSVKTVEPKLKVGPLDPGYAELTASALTPELTVSLNPHANATKGSVDGPADPGYGQASAGRTDKQREFEAEDPRRDPLDPKPGQDYTSTAQKINNNIEGRIQEAADKANNKIRAVSTLTAIKRQSMKIRHKFRTAKRMIKGKIKADKLAAKKAKQAAEKKEEAEEDTANADQGDAVATEIRKLKQHAVATEIRKLKQQELRNGVDTDAAYSLTDGVGKIDIAPSGNWVRPGRPKKEK